MSHFTVGVIVNNLTEEEVHKALAPYQENNGEDCPKEYLKFNSVTEEYKEKYENETRTMVRLENNDLVSTSDNRFKKEIKDDDHPIPTTTYEIPENLVQVKVPYKVLYPTFEEYMKDWCGYEPDEETDDYGYWENPNAKWDWYEIGGRWDSLLMIKDNVEVEDVGSPSLLFLGSEDTPKIEGYKRVNACKLKDLELDKMVEGHYDRAIKTWELLVEGAEPKNEEEKNIVTWNWYKPEYYTQKYGTKENYADIMSKFSTYAFIDEYGWHSKGNMGWWATDDSTGDSERDFITELNNYLRDEKNKEKYLVIVDCHI